jgi:hypothetical protein
VNVPITETHGNITYRPKQLRASLIAYLFADDTTLELRDAADHTLVTWLGVEDEEDAHARLAELLGDDLARWILLTTEEIL